VLLTSKVLRIRTVLACQGGFRDSTHFSRTTCITCLIGRKREFQFLLNGSLTKLEARPDISRERVAFCFLANIDFHLGNILIVVNMNKLSA